MPTPGGYSVTPGLYRVPDLKTEEEFVTYMKEVYNVEVTFTHAGDKPTDVVSRAMGQPDESTKAAGDPVLSAHNIMNFGESYSITPVEKRESSTTKSSKSK